MLIGLISDVHSNAIALKAVLYAMKAEGLQKILHAGDIVGYNPYPDETIRLFKENNIISVMGNHDRALITGDLSGFNPYAAEALKWTRRESAPVTFDHIKKLRTIESLSFDNKKIVMMHGSPYYLDEYIYPEDVVPDLLSAVNSNFLVLGHTHIQFKKEYQEGIILNPGSVGQPRDGNPDAAYAIFDMGTGHVKLKRVTYDIEKVIEDMLAAHLPEKLAFRLREGI